MKIHRLLKKFRNLTPKEEADYEEVLRKGHPAVELIVQYLEDEIVSMDKRLLAVDDLYDTPNAHLSVATLLARREATFKLRNLLVDKVELDSSLLEE